MKLLLSYESENSASERSEKVESDKDLDISPVQSVYLITYSRVVLERFPTRNAFAGLSCNHAISAMLKLNTGVVLRKTMKMEVYTTIRQFR